jgi:hypothetical protein
MAQTVEGGSRRLQGRVGVFQPAGKGVSADAGIVEDRLPLAVPESGLAGEGGLEGTPFPHRLAP